MPFVATENETGNILINYPKRPCVRVMSCGGWWSEHPNPRGYVEIQIERQIRDGRLPDAARRFAHAVQFGGHTTAEALEIIKDRDLGHIAHDIDFIDREELPDRLFRNAWVRNRRGNSAIAIDMRKARRIQLERLKLGFQRANHRRMMLGRKLIEPEWLTLGKAIRHARDTDELGRVWPVALGQMM